MKKIIALVAAALAAGLTASAETLTRTATLTAEKPTTVFAVPNGYDFAGLDSGGGTLAFAGESVIMAGVTLIPVRVADLASNVTVTATFTSGTNTWSGVPARLIRERIKTIVANPEDVGTGDAGQGTGTSGTVRRAAFATSGGGTLASASLTDTKADLIILAPPELYANWQAYATLRSAQKGITCEAVNLSDVYAAYPIGSDGVRNYAESIHKYLRTVRNTKGFSYVLLGGAWINAQHLDSNGNWTDDSNNIRYFVDGTAMSLTNCVPGVYAHPNVAEASDMFYACLDMKGSNGTVNTYPWCVGTSEDYFVLNSDLKNIDVAVDVIVARMPLKPIEVNGHTYTQEELFDGFTNKINRTEAGGDFWGTGRLGNSWNENTYYTTTYVDGQLPFDIEFWDDTPNFFSEDRKETYDDVEIVQRRIYRDYVSKYRPIIGVDTINDHVWTRGLASEGAAITDFYRKDHDYASTDSHGYSGGGGDFDVGYVKGATGITKFFDMSIPCESGEQTGTGSCFGEGSVDAPFGGAIATVANSHQGLIIDEIVMSNDAYSYKIYHETTRAFLHYNYDAGNTWLQAHLDFYARFYWNEGDARVLAEHTLFGDPLVKAEAPSNGAVADGVFPHFATNLTSSAASFTVSGSNAVMTVRSNASGTLTFKKADDADVGRMKVMQTIESYADAVTFDGVEGGVGGGVVFRATDKGSVVITNCTGRFYLGGVTNAASIAVYGKDVILDADHFNLSTLKNITLVAPEGGTNTLRGINTDALAGVTITAKGGTVKLESKDLFNKNSFVLDGATVILGVDPALGPRAVTPETMDVVFSGTGTVVYPHGSRTAMDFTIASDSTETITEEQTALVTAFTLDGISSGPTGWCTSWGGEGFDATGVLAPNGFAHTVKDGCTPWYALAAKTTRTIALYADLTDVDTTGDHVMMSLGSSTSGDNQLLLLCSGATKQISLVTTQDAGTNHFETLTADYPGDGYHLYVVQLMQGVPSLKIDTGDVQTAAKTLSMADGWQIGGQFGGVKGTHVKAIGMAVAAVRGYDAVLDADDLATLANDFPVFARPFSYSTLWLAENDTITITTNTTFTDYFGVDKGTWEIPSGVTVDAKGFMSMNDGTVNKYGYVNVRGTLNITGSGGSGSVYFNDWYWGNHAGVMGGFCGGYFTMNVYGQMLMPNSFYQIAVSDPETQTLNIDGGYMKTRGIAACSANNNYLYVQNGGVLEVESWPTYQYCTGTIHVYLKNGGTIRASSDWSNTRDMEVSGSNTVDAAGHVITMSGALSGDGTLVLMDSTEEGSGVVDTSSLDLSNFSGQIINLTTVRPAFNYPELSINLATSSDQFMESTESNCWINILEAKGNTVNDTTNIAEGVKATLSAKNSWEYTTGVTDNFLKGYLDDGNNASITVSKVPYEYYDVIVYTATDTENATFKPVYVNGKYYRQDPTNETAEVVSGFDAADWGHSRNATAVLGTNALYITGLSDISLTVKGGTGASPLRGCIAAVKLIEREAPPEPTYEYVSNSVVSINVALSSTRNGLTAANSRMSSRGKVIMGALEAVPASSWNDFTVNSSQTSVNVWMGTNTVAHSGTTVTLSAANDYGYLSGGNSGTAPAPFLGGYLDDGGSQAQITVTGVPYDTYDVIVYAATDSENAKFSPVKINDIYYIQNSTEDVATAVGGTNYCWGASRITNAVFATNALYVKNLSGDLTIVGGPNQTVSGSTCRGGIAAVQIIGPVFEPEKPEPTFTGTNFAVNVMTDADQAQTSDDAITWFNISAESGTKTYTLTNEVAATLVCHNTYYYTTGVTDTFLSGYLDDGDLDGAAKTAKAYASVIITNVPYACYDVIVYAATDTESAQFRPFRVNGIYYTQASTDEEAAETTGFDVDSWGASRQSTASLGVNALRVNNLTNSVLVVAGGEGDSSAKLRGGIAAIEVIKRDSTPEDEPAEEWTVYSSDTTIYPSDTDAMKIRVANGATLTIGHSGSGDSYNLPTDSSISIDAGAQVLFSYWGNGSQQGAAKVGNVSITGTGTFGYDSVNSYPMTMGTVTGTAILVIDDGETVTADSIENPVSLTGSATLKVLTTGTQPTLFTIPDGYHKVVSTDGDYTVYTIASDEEPEELPYHWYQFNGNTNSSGEVALPISNNPPTIFTAGARGDARTAFDVVSGSENQRIWSDDGLSLGDGDWTINLVAKMPTTADKVIFAAGSQRSNASIRKALALISTDSGVKVSAFTKGAETFAISNTMATASTVFHSYAVTYDSTTSNYTFYVDGLCKGSITSDFSGMGPQFQFGNIHGWENNNLKADDGTVDDFRVYHKALTAAELDAIRADFITINTYTVTLGECANAMVTGLPDAAVREDDAAIGFTVAVDEDCSLVAVKANGVALEGADGVYAYTVTADTTITVETRRNTVKIVVPSVEHANIASVTTNGVDVVAIDGDYLVEVGATVEVTYAADEGYSLANTTATLANVSNTNNTVDVSNIKPVEIVDPTVILPDAYLWYKFDGNTDPSGTGSVSWGGNTPSSYTEGATNAENTAFSTASPLYGTGASFGTDSWSLSLTAKLTENGSYANYWWNQGQNEAMIVVGFGRKEGPSFVIGKSGTDADHPTISLRVVPDSGKVEYLETEVDDMATAFHTYTLVCDKDDVDESGSSLVSLYVDGALKTSAYVPVGTPDGTMQFGRIYDCGSGEIPAGLWYGTNGNTVDDFRLYHEALSAQQVSLIAADFVGSSPIVEAAGLNAAETVQALTTERSAVITDATKVSVSGNTVTLGTAVITLKPYYTAKITNNTVVVELNETARPVIAAGTDDAGAAVEPLVVEENGVSIGCESIAGLWYRVRYGASLDFIGADTTKPVLGTGHALKLEAPVSSAQSGESRQFYRVEATDHR